MCYVIWAFVSLYRKQSSDTDPAKLWGWKKHGDSATGAARLWWSPNCVVLPWHGSLWRNFVPPKLYRLSCGSQKLMVAGAGSARQTFGVVRDLTIPSEWWPWGMVWRIMHWSISSPTGLLADPPVPMYNSFICTYCRIAQSAHFSLRPSCFLLFSPYSITHSKQFWPHAPFLIQAFLVTKRFLGLGPSFLYGEYPFSNYLCQRWCSASRCCSLTFSRMENTFHFWQQPCCSRGRLPHAETGCLDQTVLIAEPFGNLFHLQTEWI